jgi:hypothetical protein
MNGGLLMRNTCIVLCAVFALGLELPGATAAEAAPECTKPQELDRYRLLRRLSLDLRNKLPSIAEYLSLDDKTEVPEAVIDSWLASDEFRVSMRRFHETLLWPNPATVQLHDNSTRLVAGQGGGPTADILKILAANRRKVYRNSSDTTCGNWEQTEFEADGDTPIGKPVTDKNGDPIVGNNGKPVMQDGWVKVTPYWAPTTQVKVCAFDAQSKAEGTFNPQTSANVKCDDITTKAFSDPKCGCGPNLRWCYGTGVLAMLWSQMREQFAKQVDDVTVGGFPYTDLLLSKRIHMNGPLDFWKKYLAHMVGFRKTINWQSAGDAKLPDDPNFADTQWHVEERGDKHSGILTLPAYLLRFQTDRGRANRFRIVFTSQYFVPPEQPEDSAVDGCSDTTDDVTEKCTCRYCHQVLEPLAQYFGDVSEAGSSLTSDLADFRDDCDPAEWQPGGKYYQNKNSRVPEECDRFYGSYEGAPNPGWLLIYQYAFVDDPNHNNTGLDDTLHKSMGTNVDGGPAAMANTIIDSGQFASSSLRNVFTYLMGRDMILDPSRDDNEIDLLGELSKKFADDDGYSFKALVKRLVQLPQYRRVR